MITGLEKSNKQDTKNEPAEKLAVLETEPTEADVERLIQKMEADISAGESKTLESADKRIERVPTSVGIDPEKAKSIFTTGGFAERINSLKEKVKTLASETRDKIKRFVSSEPEIVHFKDMVSESTPIVSEVSAEEQQTKRQPEPEVAEMQEQVIMPEQPKTEQESQEQIAVEIENLQPKPVEENDKDQKYESTREFTKEQTPEERKAVAERIAEFRREQFQSERELEQKLTELLREAEEKKINAGEAVSKIQDSEEKLLQLKDDLISRLVHFREIQKLEKQVVEQKTNQEKFDEQYRTTQELISNLQIQKNDRSKLEKAKGLLKEFYADKEEEWINFEKEEKQRDVKNVLGQYGVAIVHGLIPNGAPSENTLLRSDISWQEKLKILLAFEPTISTSTISPEQQATWRNMGVLLSGGRVEVASPGDAGTKAKGLKEREVRQGHFSTYDNETGKQKTIEKQLQDTTAHRGGYNEVVVGNPEIAGFFIKINEDNSISELGDANAYVAPEDIFKVVRDMKLPLFVIKGGEVYHANPDEAEKVLDIAYLKTYKTVMKLGEKIPPAELASLPTAVNKERQDQLVTEIMDDSPFKLSMTEANCTAAMNAGREIYTGVNFNKLVSTENFTTEVYQSSGRYESKPGFVGKEMKILNVVKTPDSIQRLVSIDGKLYTEYTNKRTQRRALYDKLAYDLKLGIIVANADNGFNYGSESEENSIDSTATYLQRMKLELDKLKNDLADAEKDSSEHREFRIETKKNYLHQRAFHLYGYADEAGKNGDLESQEMASHLAMEILPRETYDEIVKRRVGPNGEFRITKEDL